ncbi:MAG: YbaB/EbfC family nucleoid-associated protein [Vampirovibrio sp.]
MMMFDMAKMMSQAKKMQDQMVKIQEDLAKTTFEGKSDCGKVKVSCTGKFENWKVDIASGLDSSVTGKLVVEALEDLTKSIMNKTQDKMGDLTKGLNIPGFKLPGF